MPTRPEFIDKADTVPAEAGFFLADENNQLKADLPSSINLGDLLVAFVWVRTYTQWRIRLVGTRIEYTRLADYRYRTPIGWRYGARAEVPIVVQNISGFSSVYMFYRLAGDSEPNEQDFDIQRVAFDSSVPDEKIAIGGTVLQYRNIPGVIFASEIGVLQASTTEISLPGRTTSGGGGGGTATFHPPAHLHVAVNQGLHVTRPNSLWVQANWWQTGWRTADGGDAADPGLNDGTVRTDLVQTYEHDSEWTRSNGLIVGDMDVNDGFQEWITGARHQLIAFALMDPEESDEDAAPAPEQRGVTGSGQFYPENEIARPLRMEFWTQMLADVIELNTGVEDTVEPIGGTFNFNGLGACIGGEFIFPEGRMMAPLAGLVRFRLQLKRDIKEPTEEQEEEGIDPSYPGHYWFSGLVEIPRAQADITLMSMMGLLEVKINDRVGDVEYSGRRSEAPIIFTDNPENGDSITIGTAYPATYTFKDELAGADDVLIGETKEETRDHLVAAINGAEGEGEIYGAGTDAHDDVWAYPTGELMGKEDPEDEQDIICWVQARDGGEAGDTITLSDDSSAISTPLATLDNGSDELRVPEMVGLVRGTLNLFGGDEVEIEADSLDEWQTFERYLKKRYEAFPDVALGLGPDLRYVQGLPVFGGAMVLSADEDEGYGRYITEMRLADYVMPDYVTQWYVEDSTGDILSDERPDIPMLAPRRVARADIDSDDNVQVPLGMAAKMFDGPTFEFRIAGILVPPVLVTDLPDGSSQMVAAASVEIMPGRRGQAAQIQTRVRTKALPYRRTG